tara:strand:+ start:409 stop:699 length:291 start_codon:yes stop_codon:yes gene_type:complete
MEVNKDKLIEVLKSIDSRLSNLERLLDTKPKVNSNSDSSTDLIPKATIDFQSLLAKINDNKGKSIVASIFNNNYHTVTSGQFKLISDIASQNNFTI